MIPLRKPWNTMAAAGVIIAFGFLRLPLEHAQEETWRSLHLRAGVVNLEVREQLGQMGFVAVLGGFRSPVASFLSLEAYAAWRDVDWAGVQKAYDLITALQPRVVDYWDEYGWHMAWNAYSHYIYDDDLPEEIRVQLAERYLDKGVEILKDGIRHNPEDYLLHIRLGELLRAKKKDPCGAADAFEAAAACEGAPAYAARFAAYELSECPGREEEAYRRLADLYREGSHHHKPTLIGKIRTLEEQLDIPLLKRVLMNDSR